MQPDRIWFHQTKTNCQTCFSVLFYFRNALSNRFYNNITLETLVKHLSKGILTWLIDSLLLFWFIQLSVKEISCSKPIIRIYYNHFALAYLPTVQ